ncbi:mannose-6-phosphate receptor binding domain-containing protein [Cantharellus anzutake]|uniref:mannose-6-phosphate receptor binding domain-containing protein n=1 Tax=Cantharellus anzutake TaxID=1750568 RepID=UPI0019066763|nr:mannose-6-phosphate receptor binding domain-containing protein [Cantharellus anzutake]KAF8336375.1 mannose-6-phosphate receptor binding domain-containing protein [Cantharellus anzutake]
MANTPEPRPCTAYDGPNFYDLNPLRAKKDYEALSDVGIRNLTLNICGSVLTETWNLGDAEHVGGFFRGTHSDISIGKANTTLTIAHGHPLIILSDGSPCNGSAAQDSGIRRSTAIRFLCDPNVFSKGTPRLIAQLPPDDNAACAFFVEWRTHVACPTATPGSTGGVLLLFGVIAFVAFLAYFLGATFYNRMVLGLRGWEQLPTFTLSGLRDFLSECVTRRSRNDFSQPSWGSWRNSGGRNGYGRLAAEEQEAIAHTRFSLDEDEEGAGDARPLTDIAPPHPTSGDGIIRL